MTLPPGTPIKIYPDKHAGKHAQPKLGKVRNHWVTSAPKSDYVTVSYDDGSPPDVVRVSPMEPING